MNTTKKEMVDIQKQLDDQYEEYYRRELHMRADHYKTLHPILADRDQLAAKIEDFWAIAFLNYEIVLDLLPAVDDVIETKWIKSLAVYYEDPNFLCVKIEINPNPIISNEVLFKKFSVLKNEMMETEIKWKMLIQAPIISFFESKKYDIELFDILYELYVNAFFYYSLQFE